MALRRVGFLFLMVCFSVLAAQAEEFQPASSRQIFRSLIQAYELALFERYPEAGLLLGRKEVALDRFTDRSEAALIAWQQTEDELAEKLSTLNSAEFRETPQYTTYLLLTQSLENGRATRICQDDFWNLNPMGGWHTMMTTVAEVQPLETRAHRAAALKRWRTFDRVVQDEIVNLKKGLERGYSAPQPVVDRVVQQLHLTLDVPLERSPYFELVRRSENLRFRQQMKAVITSVIIPALQGYLHFLEEEYRPQARDSVGVSAHPQGEACYLAKIKQETTLSLSPQEIFDYGLQHMAALEQEVAIVGEKHFKLKALAQVFERLKNDKTTFFRSKQGLLAYNEAALRRAKAAVPQWFSLMPRATAVIKPYPAYRAQTGAVGEYHPPSEDGKQPGIFYINAAHPKQQSRAAHEATLYHELIPGHHFQIALEYEDQSQEHLNRYLGNAGYIEGWALYVERLADEMGLYSDDISRLGMLSNEALRTARLVVDPGIHVRGWTRAEAVTYMRQHTAMDPMQIESEVDRYIMMPAQATAYLLGKREIEALRDWAQKTNPQTFDIRFFHDRVLERGAVTLPMLRTYIEHAYVKE